MVVPWGSGGGGVYTYYKVSTFSLESWQPGLPTLLTVEKSSENRFDFCKQAYILGGRLAQ